MTNLPPETVSYICNALGLCGVALTLYCYARVQWQRDYAKHLSYSVLNAVASVLFLVSLSNNFNFPSFTCNALWLLISSYGIYRCCKYIWRDRKARMAVAP